MTVVQVTVENYMMSRAQIPSSATQRRKRPCPTFHSSTTTSKRLLRQSNCHIVTKKSLTPLLRNRHTTQISCSWDYANGQHRFVFFLSSKLTAKPTLYVDIWALVAFHDRRHCHHVSGFKGSRIRRQMFVLAFQFCIF